MTTLNTMIKRCSGLLDTNDLSEWESDFIANLVERTHDGDNTTSLTERQIDCLEKIFNRHFSA